MKTILLCSDLDRTLIPNGAEPESPQARPTFAHLAAHPNLRLAYVSGRDKILVEQAIKDYDLPDPDFVIGDVGTSLYHIVGGRWLPNESWQHAIGRDWQACSRDDIVALLDDMQNKDFTLQDEHQQGRFKISYFTDLSEEARKLKDKVRATLEDNGIAANLIWSRDDAEKRGLLDILPRRANKLEAIRFLTGMVELDESRVVFAGDSGNDLEPLTSGLKAILVKNAASDVHQAVMDHLSREGKTDCLYRAKGGFGGMNGNYAAGVVEGVVHFFPEATDWIASVLNQSLDDGL